LQTKKWATLIQQEVEAYCVEGIDLLKATEQTEEGELLDQEPEEKMPLSKVMVENITKARENGLNMGLCDKKRNKETGWGGGGGGC
jgi:hypothetical protein